MTVAPVQRREPVQARSRLTVIRILDAAAAIADEHGVEAATTRAIADRAGVSYPSLYRFFADRDAILGELLERHVADLDARCVEAERAWETIRSFADLLNNEIDLHVAFYCEHPSTARMWMGGRTSPAVTAHVRARMQTLAGRMHTLLVDANCSRRHRPARLLVSVEMADRMLELPTATATASTRTSSRSAAGRSLLSAMTFPGGQLFSCGDVIEEFLDSFPALGSQADVLCAGPGFDFSQRFFAPAVQ